MLQDVAGWAQLFRMKIGETGVAMAVPATARARMASGGAAGDDLHL